MKLQIVPFDVATYLKDLGFNWKCTNCFFYENPFYSNEKINWNDSKTYISAPETSLVVKWFREIHNIQIIVEIASDSKTSDYVYSWNIWRNHKHGRMDLSPMNGSDWEGYDNFEKAELEGIRTAIRYLKKDNS